MERRISSDEYFSMPETNSPVELVYGTVREPPAPHYGHQRVVGQLFFLLKAHVTQRTLGEVCVSPIDVVLDKDAGLIVQPDVIFIAAERRSIIQNHIWGAPDLVVEVASPSSEYRDQTVKRAWYRTYGVGEYWIVHPGAYRIDVADCTGNSEETFTGTDQIRSRVLPDLRISAEECFR